MEKELLSAVIPMMVFKKEIYEFVETLVKEKVQGRKKNLLNVEEAATYLNVKVSWLRQAIFRREINHVKVGALVRFREEDLENYVHKNLKSFRKS